MSSKKKRRSPNFSPEEQSVFFALLARYVHIIENRKTDAATINEKEEAWREIASKFNAGRSGCFRNQTTLHKFYVNRKAVVRKAVKQQEAKVVQLSETDAMLLNILNDKNVNGSSGNSSDSEDIYFVDGSQIQEMGDVINDICIVDQSTESLKSAQVVNDSGHVENNIQIVAKGEPIYSRTHKQVNKPKRASSHEDSLTNSDWNAARPVIVSENSSDVGKKNEQLLAMKLEAANLQIAVMKSELSCKQSEQLFKHEEQRLKIEILKTELEIKKHQLKRHLEEDDV